MDRSVFVTCFSIHFPDLKVTELEKTTRNQYPLNLNPDRQLKASGMLKISGGLIHEKACENCDF